MFKLSIVIPNYNYEDYVSAAIESALGVKWDNVEVIVIDDGSTDNSVKIIKQFERKIIFLQQKNMGQRKACDKAFNSVTGDVVIFLDSDDLLDPDIAHEIAAVWHNKVSKIQFETIIIDQNGHHTEEVFPRYPSKTPTCEDIRDWYLSSFAYPTPPGSGNAYSAQFLRKILPVSTNFVDRAADSYLLASAPLLGDVVTVPKAMVYYRIHGMNQGAVSKINPSRFSLEVSRGLSRYSYAKSIAKVVNLDFAINAIDRSLSFLPYRLASIKLNRSNHPIAGDTKIRIIIAIARSVFVPQGSSLGARISILVWSILVSCSPSRLAQLFILWRFSPRSRPIYLKKLIYAIK